MSEEREDVPFPHLTLLLRTEDASSEWAVSVETSLFRSNVTGFYLLEQVQRGRHGTTVNSISLSPATVAEFLPLLSRIADEGAREGG